MKKKRLVKKLTLKKETVADLNFSQMGMVNGGGVLVDGDCKTGKPDCPPATTGPCVTDPPSNCGCPESSEAEPCFCPIYIPTIGVFYPDGVKPVGVRRF